MAEKYDSDFRCDLRGAAPVHFTQQHGTTKIWTGVLFTRAMCEWRFTMGHHKLRASNAMCRIYLFTHAHDFLSQLKTVQGKCAKWKQTDTDTSSQRIWHESRGVRCDGHVQFLLLCLPF